MRKSTKEHWIYILSVRGFSDEPYVIVRKIGPYPTKKAARKRASVLPPAMWDVTSDVPKHVGFHNIEGLKHWFLSEYVPHAKHFVFVEKLIQPKSRFRKKDAVMCLKAGAACRTLNKDGSAWDSLGLRLAKEVGLKPPLPCTKCDEGVYQGQPCRECLGSSVLPPHYSRRQK